MPKLLRALIDPGADEADFFSGQRLRRRAVALAAGSAGTFGVGRSFASLGRFTGFLATAGATSTGARTAGLGRHGRLGINACNRSHDIALGAVADNEDFAIFTAL